MVTAESISLRQITPLLSFAFPASLAGRARCVIQALLVRHAQVRFDLEESRVRKQAHKTHFLQWPITEASVSGNSRGGNSGIQGPISALLVMLSVPKQGGHRASSDTNSWVALCRFYPPPRNSRSYLMTCNQFILCLNELKEVPLFRTQKQSDY